MIAVWMLYCMGIGLAFVVVGHALEKGLHFAGRPTRWAWVVALVGAYAVPLAGWLRPDAFETFAAPIPIESSANQSTFTSSSTSTILDHPPPRPFSLTDLDVPLRWGWGAGSVLMLLALGIAATRLVSARRRWRQEAIDGRVVLVSRNVGPAVVGVWSPRVVLPEWALRLPASDRELMLAHEEQHLRAADPALLACGFVLVLLAPWNLALWWQWRRLRLAVEMDCDARVLAEGRSAPAYGELLLHVGRRRSTPLIGAAAFGEPASFLESRIRRMVTGMPRWRWAGAFVALVVATGALVGACETPLPVASDRRSAGSVAQPLDSARAIAIAVDNLCGGEFSLRDATCFVRGQQRTGDGYVVVLDRRPPAGNDRLRVELVGSGDNVWLKARPLAPAPVVSPNHDAESVSTDPYVFPKVADLEAAARRYHPEMFAGPQKANSAIALVFDSQRRLLGHAAGIREVGDDGCDAVVTRLVPAFAGTRFAASGCAELTSSGGPIVYWRTQRLAGSH